MTSSSKRVRLVFAASLSVLWTAWACWSNNPHRYDAQAMEQELAQLVPFGPVPKLEPAVGGFPVVHMRYDFSRNDQLTMHEFSKDKLGLNVLLCALATISVIILALRTTLSRSTLAIAACLLLPVCLAYALFGLHPFVITYAYFLPVALLVGSSLVGLLRTQKGQNEAMNRSRGVAVFDN